MTVAVEINPEYMLLAGGLFDTHNRYIRKVPSGETMAMVNGASMAAALIGDPGEVHWRWQVGGATFTGGGSPPGTPSAQTLIAL